MPSVIRITCFLFALSAVVHGLSFEDSEFSQGVVKPSKEVFIAAEIGGVLKAIAVDEGDFVKQSQVIVQIDDSLQQVALEAAKMRAESQAELKNAQLVLDEAQISLERVETAFRKDAANEWEVRQAALERDQAKAGLEAAQDKQKLAEIELKMEQEKLERYKLRAPFDGQITRLLFEEGATVAEDEDLIHLIKMNPLEAELHLSADLLKDLQTGRQYMLIADAPVNDELIATLDFVDRNIDTASLTIRCVFTIDNADLVLPSGFTVRLKSPEPIDE